MITPFYILDKIRQETEEIILFHSAAGKDSIALLDMCSKRFNKVICIYMYYIKDLEHINKYIAWAENKYSNCKFFQYPHYALASYIQSGEFGCKKNENIKKYSLADITERACLNHGIEWSVFGMKQTDGMNRRLMLRTYEDNAIFRKTKKAYPLSEWKNKDVLKYIQVNRLINPLSYGGTGQSSGASLQSEAFLTYCKEKYPRDYQKVLDFFPEIEIIMFNYEQKRETRE